MKVYAEFLIKNGVEYRRKTLLQFGGSTKLIGSAVLMNPGSSKNTGKTANSELIKSFFKDNHNRELSNSEISEWYDYTDDSTMRQLEYIFNGWYLHKKGIIEQITELNGIIQLFNCSYYKNQHLSNAKHHFAKDEDVNFEEYNLITSKPVYFGWGNEGKMPYGSLYKMATTIFDEYMKSNSTNKSIYKSTFENNLFYHPGYVNRGYGRNTKLQEFLYSFFVLMNKS